MIQTFGGFGDLTMNVNGDIMVFAFDDFFEIFGEDEFMKEGERQAPSNNFESDEITVESNGEDTEQMIYLDLPANGQFDITLTALEAISDVTIVASWVYRHD